MSEEERLAIEEKLKNEQRKKESKEVLIKGDINLIRNLIKCLSIQERADSTLREAQQIYSNCDDLPISWKKKAAIDSIRVCNQSFLLQQEANYLRVKTFISALFADIEEDNNKQFINKMVDLIKGKYFINLGNTEYKTVSEYLLTVFLKNGIDDVIELLSKIKFLNITTQKKPIIKCKNNLKVINEGIVDIDYFKSEKSAIIDLEHIKITIGENLENDNRKYAIWHELSRIMKQPINQILSDEELESMSDEYLTNLLKEPKLEENKK